jgi:hypothetical protein
MGLAGITAVLVLAVVTPRSLAAAAACADRPCDAGAFPRQ